MQKSILILLFIAGGFSLFSQADRIQKIKAFDAYVDQARLQWNEPGLAIVVVKNGEVLLQKGYGKRNINHPEPVDPQTLFACASTTKAMTACAMGMLVDEGKLSWDDRVIDHLPEFKIADAYVTQNMRIRDLFTHNGGLGNADFLWAGADLSAKEIIERMKYAPLAYPFRGGYTYQNIMYFFAGEVITRVSGKPWSEFLQERIFKPLEMTRTYPTTAASKAEKNRSTPHYIIKDAVTAIQDEGADVIGAAGSVWSCVSDISKWMRFALDSAKVNGKRLLKPETYAEWFKPQAMVSTEGFYPTASITQPHWKTYALGWFQQDYQGKFVNFHTGSLSGTTAIHGLLLDEKMGVYIYGNLDHAEVRHALMFKAFDVFGNGNAVERDWSTEFRKLYQGIEQKTKTYTDEKEKQRVMNTQPSLALKAYAGTYSDPFYGSVKLSLVDGVLKADMSSTVSMTLAHWHFDTFKGAFNRAWYGSEWVTFQLDSDGKVASLQLSDGSTMKKVN
jgi:CubicO group peptidase (beta-lactamase class C family)